MLKRIIILLVVTGAVLWAIRIINVNKNDKNPIRYVGINEAVNAEGIEIIPVASAICTLDDYLVLTGLDENEFLHSGRMNGEMIVFIRFRVRNVSPDSFNWSYVYRKLGYGFESSGWMSNSVPYYTADLNVVYGEKFEPGAETYFWFAAGINPVSFDAKHWNNLMNIDFYYVLDVYPNSIRVKIGV